MGSASHCVAHYSARASGGLRSCEQGSPSPSPSSATTLRAGWNDDTGATLAKEFPTEREAVLHIASCAPAVYVFHDLRHSYAPWLVDDGVPVNMVQRVLGHERSSTTLDRYTRRTDDHGRILRALDDVC